MKKRILMGLTALAVVGTLTGCGSKKNKTLTCTQSTEAEGMKTEEKLVYKLKDNKVTKLTETRKVTFDGDSKELLEEYKNSAQESVDSFKDIEGVTAKTDTKDSTITTTITYDAKKVDSSLKEAQLLNESYESIKEIKGQQNGYTCK